MELSPADRLSRARLVLMRRGVADADLLPPDIYESWSRCLALGLDPMRPPRVVAAGTDQLREAREKNLVLRKLALAEMESLYHQVAGTNFMIAFAAPDGMLLDTMSDATFNSTADATNIRPGMMWGEARCGTNALGTVAQTGKPVTVHGAEHFFSRYGGLTCIAAPVFQPDGILAGVLDASSDCRSRQQHTRALVGMAAMQIENGLFRRCHRGDTLIAFHSRGEYLHTLSAGLLAVDPDGKILAANAPARFLLQGLPTAPGRAFAEVFRTGLRELLDGAETAGRQRLEDRVGSVFSAKLENVWRSRPVAVTLPPASFVAEDEAVAASVRQVAAAAKRKVPILIRGETGTGKEQLARHAHAASQRRGAFVPVNCAALPEALVEAELFGHADGAFTGARRGGAPGLVVEADGGTLFLDEIGDMKPPLQSVLLRLLDDWTVRPVGGGRRRIVDVLLVAATNSALEPAVAEGRFRADLYYRLNTVEVTLPPLTRRTDLGAIARHLLSGIAPRCRLLPEAIEALAARPWPGNIRELGSALTRLMLDDPSVLDARAVASLGADGAPRPAAPRTLRESQRAQIVAALRETGGNVSATARTLSVSRNTVYRALGGRLRIPKE